jgi:threonine dehydrogenase-like Zn-dependent dehydrogenase
LFIGICRRFQLTEGRFIDRHVVLPIQNHREKWLDVLIPIEAKALNGAERTVRLADVGRVREVLVVGDSSGDDHRVECASGLFGQCERRRFLGLGGFTEYLKTSEKGLYFLPASIDTRIAAVVEPFACAVSGVRRANLRGGETVVVLGAGVLGLCAAGAAKALGARKVIISAKYDAQAELAKRFGADVVLRSGKADLVEQIKAETGGRGADLVVETVGGHAPTLSQALDILRPGCSIVVLGLWDDPVPVDSWSAVLKDARMIFSLTYGITGKQHDFEVCLDWMAAGKVPAAELVTHVRPLSEIREAFELAADKSQGVIKVILNP